MPPRIVILGGGVGGTLTANLLSKKLGHKARITLVDASGIHVFQPGWMYLALDQADSRWLSRDVRHLLRKDVMLVVDSAEKIDAEGHQLHLGNESVLDYDYLVVATGARLDRAAIPGLAAATHDFYSFTGAERLREQLRLFEGGDLVVGISGTPYSCPPAPVEFALLAEEYLQRNKVRNQTTIRFLSPLDQILEIGAASRVVEPIFEQRGIELRTEVAIAEAASNKLTSEAGEEFAFDLAVVVPPHRGSLVIEQSDMGNEGGWLPTNPVTLRAKEHDDIFALGDCTDLAVSKTGATAHFEAPVIVEQIVALIEDRRPDPDKSRYRGKTTYFLEVGDRRATVLTSDYESPPKPPRPLVSLHAAKWAFNRAYWLTVPRGRI